MKFSIISIFPEMIDHFITFGLLAKAIEKKKITVVTYDLRTFSKDKHKKVDDRPFGGGAGMVLTPQPLFDAVETIKKKQTGRVILFSAYAPRLDQKKLKELAKEEHLIMICGRYEGVDQRVIDQMVDEEISLGDYVLMGGEVAAQVLLEGVSRMIPGIVGKQESVESDSFFNEHQYGYPQYTQPRHFRGLDVPEVLLGGHHKEIDEWRKAHQKKRS